MLNHPLFTAVLLLLGTLISAAVAPDGRAADAATAYQVCTSCHGASGDGDPAQQAPALAGQQADYLARQLRHFRDGIRGADATDTAGALMRPMAATLTDADITALADYLARLPAPVVAPAAGADLRNGNDYYQSKCGACHGGRAEGNAALNSPALAGLDAVYLKRQFQNFQRGLRGSHAGDKFGRQMKMMSTALSADKDLDDVIAFIQAQGGQAPAGDR